MKREKLVCAISPEETLGMSGHMFPLRQAMRAAVLIQDRYFTQQGKTGMMGWITGTIPQQ